MSDTITLGKSRKDGKWQVLVQPERPFGEHLDAYRKIANSHPVSDEFSKVVIGKLNHSSPALVFISKDDNAKRLEVEASRNKTVADSLKAAEERQAKKNEDSANEKAAEHADIIAEKNELINRIRKDSGQFVQAKALPLKTDK